MKEITSITKINAFWLLLLLLSLTVPIWAANDTVSSTIQKMSLEEKVGQLLVVHFRGETVNEEARALVQEIGVGGIIYYNWANGLKNPEQVQNLSIGLQQLTQFRRSPIPLFIAVDQEGGVVTRLLKGFTQFPGNRAIGESGDPQLAESAAIAMGEELRLVGVNTNFAPVVDVNSNPKNPAIGIRSFGETPELVCSYGEKALRGYKNVGIITSLKHFPGHGAVVSDSHEELPSLRKNMAELEKMELVPFAKLCRSADMIMTAHILVPALDPVHCSTLSEKTLSYLRNKLGFKGVIITDSMIMSGVLKNCASVDEAAIRALNAGCDLILLGGSLLISSKAGFELTLKDVRRIHQSIVSAVKSGQIPQERINQALEVVLKLKERTLDNKIPKPQANLSQLLNTPAHREVAKKIATGALKRGGRAPNHIGSVTRKKLLIVAPEVLGESLKESGLLTLGTNSEVHFFKELNPSQEEIEKIVKRTGSVDFILVCAYNAWQNPKQEKLIQLLAESPKPMILIATREPIDLALFPKAEITFRTFSPTLPSLQAVYESIR